MNGAELERLAEEDGIDVVGGLFADMTFTMAEESCHPETLLPGAQTVVRSSR